jgi:hypothetical protein
MKIFLSVLLLALAACASNTSSTGAPLPPLTPQQMVFQFKNDYNVALTIAVAYKNLPPCEAPGAPKICSKVSVVHQLQQADYVAFPAITAAENTVRNPCPVVTTPPCDPASKMQLAVTGASQALAALTSITATLQTK